MLFTTLIFYSCIEQEPKQESTIISEEIENAKIWFKQNELTLWEENDLHARGSKNEVSKSPNWNLSKHFLQADGKEVVEVKLDYELVVIPEHLSSNSPTNESILHSLILFPKANGNYVPYILKVMPEDSNVKFDSVDFFEGGYKNIPSDFSGSYEFYTWNEKLIGGWGIKDGKKVTRIKPLNKSNSKSSARTSEVYCYELITNWYSVGCIGDICSEPTLIDHTISVQCDYYAMPPSLAGEGDGGGGNPGGGDPSDGEPCEFPEENLFDVPISCEEEEWDEDTAIAEIEEVYGTINDCEKAFIKSNFLNFNSIVKVFNNSVIADETTKSVYGYNSTGDGWNNCADAFRHTYWNALNAISVSENIAEGLATAHECSGYNYLEKDMDLKNNEIGRTIGAANTNLNLSHQNDINTLINIILMNIASGNSWVIYPRASDNSVLLSSNVVSSINHCN